MKGKRRFTAEEKKLSGSPKRKERPKAPGMPLKPPGLSSEELRIWDATVKLLVGTLGRVDSVVLEHYVKAKATLERYETTIRKVGEFYKAPSGKILPNPVVVRYEKVIALVRSLEADLGLAGPRSHVERELPISDQRVGSEGDTCPDSDAPWCTPDDCSLCPSWRLAPDLDGEPWPSLCAGGNWPTHWPDDLNDADLKEWLRDHADGVLLVEGEYTTNGACPDKSEPWCHETAGCDGCPSLACKPVLKGGPWIKLRKSRRWPAGWPVNRNLRYEIMKQWLSEHPDVLLKEEERREDSGQEH
jgi:phage terminase small subunit